MTIPITDPSDGREVGSIQIALYEDAASLGQRFGVYLSRVPFSVDYPLGVVEDMQVDEKERRKGFGWAGLVLADLHFARLGVRTAILKVGWSPEEDWESAKAWRVRWYERAGWTSLPWSWPEPVLMVKAYRAEPGAPGNSRRAGS